MFWQAWTAFGIMLGCLSGVALQHLGNVSNPEICPPTDPSKLLEWSCSKNWRLILASPSILPIFLLLYIYTCHESPRWAVAEGHRLRINLRPEAAKHYYQKAYSGLEALSRHELLAARDMLSHYYLLDEESRDLAYRLEKHPRRVWLVHQLFELSGRRRNRRAIMASSICMFAQQFWYGYIPLDMVALTDKHTVASISLCTTLISCLQIYIFQRNCTVQRAAESPKSTRLNDWQ